MNELVDTCIWSLSLRRSRRASLSPAERRMAASLQDCIEDGRTIIIGPIRQELFSGIRDRTAFGNTRQLLEPFLDEDLTTDDYIEAARMFNLCQDHGIQSGSVDMLIAAVAARRNFSVLTNDQALIRCLDVLGIPHA